MNKGIFREDVNKIKDKLCNEIKSESITINSIKDVFSNINSYVKESHEDNFSSTQNELIKVSNNLKRNHENDVIILQKNIEKYTNVVLENKKIFIEHL